MDLNVDHPEQDYTSPFFFPLNKSKGDAFHSSCICVYVQSQREGRRTSPCQHAGFDWPAAITVERHEVLLSLACALGPFGNCIVNKTGKGNFRAEVMQVGSV